RDDVRLVLDSLSELPALAEVSGQHPQGVGRPNGSVAHLVDTAGATPPELLDELVFASYQGRHCTGQTTEPRTTACDLRVAPPLLSRPTPRSRRIVLFFAADGQTGRELWKSEGTEAGTVLVGVRRASPLPRRPARGGPPSRRPARAGDR